MSRSSFNLRIDPAPMKPMPVTIPWITRDCASYCIPCPPPPTPPLPCLARPACAFAHRPAFRLVRVAYPRARQATWPGPCESAIAPPTGPNPTPTSTLAIRDPSPPLPLAPVVRFVSLRQSLSKNKREAKESVPVVRRFLYTCVATRNCAECARGSHIRRARRGPDRLPFLAALPPEYQRHLPESGTALRLDQAPRVRPQHPLRQQVIPPPCFPTQR